MSLPLPETLHSCFVIGDPRLDSQFVVMPAVAAAFAALGVDEAELLQDADGGVVFGVCAGDDAREAQGSEAVWMKARPASVARPRPQ